MRAKWHIGALIVAVLVAVAGTGAVGAQDRLQRKPSRAVRTIMVAVVEQTGLSAREVLERVRDGQALAEIITAQSGDVEVVAEAAEAALTERIHTAVAEGLITQQQADEALENLPATVRRALNGEIPQQRLDAATLRRAARRIVLKAVADETGLRPLQIVRQMASGAPLSDIVAAANANPRAIRDAALAAAAEQMNEAVADGRLTQKQVDRALERFQAVLEAQLGLAQP